MLNNFIYTKTKDLFLKELEAGNVLDEAIVFIEDTKEIWNHGTYFDCSTINFEEILKDYVIKDEIADFVPSSTLQDYVTKEAANVYIDKASAQAITGEKTFNSIININSKTNIRPNIDSGELKVTHNNSDKGFIIRTKNCEDNVLPLEILSTDGYSSYQYNFPKTSGNVVLGVKKGTKTITANLTDGLLDLNEECVKVTYNELKNLRNNGQLISGQKYRITDYKTTAIVNSVADHKFDIIVTALDSKILSEDAKVTITDGDIGSKVSELFSWDMNPGNWQNIDIPELQFGDSTIYYQQGTRSVSQAGIIKVTFTPIQEDPETDDVCIGADIVKDNVVVSKDYHIGRINYDPRQEENNVYYLPISEAGSYVIRYFVKGASSGFETNLKITAELYEGYSYFANTNLNAWEIRYCLDNDTTRFNWAGSENGKGVIYYMKDEHGNECPYDFKNILFNDYYTFSYIVNDVIYDGTIKYNSCYGNRILGTFNQDGTQKLNNIVFKNTSSDALCCYNIFGWNNEQNIFGNACASNTFGNYCVNNTFGNNCQYNTFGDFCQNNSFNNFCQSNNFGTQCQSNSFGSYIIRITFGKQCLNNKFTNSSSGSDLLLEACRMIKFGDQCNGVNLYTTSEPSYNSGKWMQNITVSNALSGNIEITILNDSRNLYITKNADNSIHKYYESDLISNVKTINGQSLIGEGNIDLHENFVSYDSLSNYIVQDLYTEPSLLPYKFMGHSIYQLLIPRANFINNQVQLNLPITDLALIDVSSVGTIKTCLEANYDSGILTVNCTNENAWDNCRYVKIVYTSIPPEKQGLYFIINKPIDGQLKLDGFPLDRVSDTEYVYRYGIEQASSFDLTYSVQDTQTALNISKAYAISDGNRIDNIILNNNMYQYTIQLDPNAKLYEVHLEII